jgi:hypothetical protein
MSRLSMFGSGVGMTPSPNQPPLAGADNSPPEHAPVTGPSGVGMLTCIWASMSDTEVEDTAVTLTCLSKNVTDGNCVFHLNAALARCSHWPNGCGNASNRA